MTLDKATADSLSLDSPCATCPHEFGDHSHKGLHRCLEAGCGCAEFAMRPQVAGRGGK